MGRLTDKQKKQIFADRIDGMSTRKLAAKYHTSPTTVRRVLKQNPEMARKVAEKKEQNTEDILAYMDTKRDVVKELINLGLTVLPEKITGAKSATEVTTALGTLIDKWTQLKQIQSKEQAIEDDELTASIKALGEAMEAERERSKNSPSAK